LEHCLIWQKKKLVMKNKVVEALFSLLALYLFSCAIGAAILLGILLVPIVLAALLVLAVRDLFSRKKKTRQTDFVKVKGKVITITRWMPRDRKAA